jgi:hypothetical protein
MRFRRASIAGVIYGNLTDDSGPEVITGESRQKKSPTGLPLEEISANATETSALRAFLNIMSLCHTSVLQGRSSGESGDNISDLRTDDGMSDDSANEDGDRYSYLFAIVLILVLKLF